MDIQELSDIVEEFSETVASRNYDIVVEDTIVRMEGDFISVKNTADKSRKEFQFKPIEAELLDEEVEIRFVFDKEVLERETVPADKSSVMKELTNLNPE